MHSSQAGCRINPNGTRFGRYPWSPHRTDRFRQTCGIFSREKSVVARLHSCSIAIALVAPCLTTIDMPENPRYTVNFQPREGILNSLRVTKAEFDETVLHSFVYTRRDCRASPHDLPVVFNGRQYRLTEIAYIQVYGPNEQIAESA